MNHVLPEPQMKSWKKINLLFLKKQNLKRETFSYCFFFQQKQNFKSPWLNSARNQVAEQLNQLLLFHPALKFAWERLHNKIYSLGKAYEHVNLVAKGFSWVSNFLPSIPICSSFSGSLFAFQEQHKTWTECSIDPNIKTEPFSSMFAKGHAQDY